MPQQKKTPKKTVNRRRQQNQLAESVRHQVAEPALEQTVAVEPGPVKMSADPSRKLARVMDQFISATDAAAEYAAIADGLLERNNTLEAENKKLRERVQELEMQLFKETEETPDEEEG